MSDLDQIRAILSKLPDPEFDVSTEELNCGKSDPKAHFVLRVLPGYRAHFEMEFDKNGNIVSAGAWEDM